LYGLLIVVNPEKDLLKLNDGNDLFLNYLISGVWTYGLFFLKSYLIGNYLLKWLIVLRFFYEGVGVIVLSVVSRVIFLWDFIIVRLIPLEGLGLYFLGVI
jgi:hypothetical protein